VPFVKSVRELFPLFRQLKTFSLFSLSCRKKFVSLQIKNQLVMAEELTTEMHFEFLEDMGTDRLSYFVFAARGAMNRGLSKAEALKRYGLSEAVYDAGIDRVLSTDDWWGSAR